MDFVHQLPPHTQGIRERWRVIAHNRRSYVLSNELEDLEDLLYRDWPLVEQELFDPDLRDDPDLVEVKPTDLGVLDLVDARLLHYHGRDLPHHWHDFRRDTDAPESLLDEFEEHCMNRHYDLAFQAGQEIWLEMTRPSPLGELGKRNSLSECLKEISWRSNCLWSSNSSLAGDEAYWLLVAFRVVLVAYLYPDSIYIHPLPFSVERRGFDALRSHH
jgi:hypothetical protein